MINTQERILKKYNVLIPLAIVGLVMLVLATFLALKGHRFLTKLRSAPDIEYSDEMLRLSRAAPTAQQVLWMELGETYSFVATFFPLHYGIRAAVEKRDLLDHQFATLPYGDGYQGLEEWSLHCFGRPASTLSLSESAYALALAGVQSPLAEEALQMEEAILVNLSVTALLFAADLMGIITDEEYDAATEPVICLETRSDFL